MLARCCAREISVFTFSKVLCEREISVFTFSQCVTNRLLEQCVI